MGVSTRSVGSALVAIVGREAVLDDAGSLSKASVDGRTPRWIARPASVAELAAVMSVAHDEGLAVVPRGSGSALDVGWPPTRVDLVVDTARLDGVLEDKPDDLTISVGAGITLGALAARLAARRQLFPVDPACAGTRTLGGIAATNASGPLRCRYGTIRDLLLGVRFVQPDGVVTWGGARVVKSVTGYDVPKLMVGSLGTLGVLVELTLRLHPMPACEGSWLVAVPDLDHAQAFVAAVLDSTLQPNRLEIMNRAAAASSGVTTEGPVVAVSIGSVEAAVGAQETAVRTLAATIPATVTEAPAGWWDRYATALAAATTVARIATLASHLAPTVAELERALGADAAVWGSAAVGTLFAASRSRAVGQLQAAVAALREFCGSLGGSVTLLRAPADVRSAVDPWGPVAPDALALMRRIKDEFDPTRALNPGRFVGQL